MRVGSAMINYRLEKVIPGSLPARAPVYSGWASEECETGYWGLEMINGETP